jgi:hypothetical protein
MNYLHKTTNLFLLILFLLSFSMEGKVQCQSIVSYAYDNAGNRISRKVVLLSSNPTHVKKDTISTPAPVAEQLGDRKITVFPNPTKGDLAVDITGGNDKDEMQIVLISAQGIQLQTLKAVTGTTPVNMLHYPPGWFILRVKAGDKMTEFKIIKQ